MRHSRCRRVWSKKPKPRWISRSAGRARSIWWPRAVAGDQRSCLGLPAAEVINSPLDDIDWRRTETASSNSPLAEAKRSRHRSAARAGMARHGELAVDEEAKLASSASSSGPPSDPAFAVADIARSSAADRDVRRRSFTLVMRPPSQSGCTPPDSRGQSDRHQGTLLLRQGQP
jgi:hypothetical protein